MRELYLSLRCIGVRRHNNHAMQAALRGVKIPLRSVGTQVRNNSDFTPEEADAAEKAMMKAMNRKKVEKDFA